MCVPLSLPVCFGLAFLSCFFVFACVRVCVCVFVLSRPSGRQCEAGLRSSLLIQMQNLISKLKRDMAPYLEAILNVASTYWTVSVGVVVVVAAIVCCCLLQLFTNYVLCFLVVVVVVVDDVVFYLL